MTQNTPPSPLPAPPYAPAPAAPPYAYPPPWWTPPKKKSFLRRWLKGVFILLFILSVLLNIEIGAIIMSRGQEMASAVLEEGDKDQVVAVYEVGGVINDKASQKFREFYRTVRDDKSIKAVCLRVNSPGGTVSASDQIHQMVLAIRQDLKRPVVVSMGGYAASGGYYISAPADEIYAEPTTITGSIGVLAEWPVVKNLLDKIGVEIEVARSTHAEQWKAREFDLTEKPDPAVRKRIQEMLDAMQDRFEQVVTDGRGKKLHFVKVPATMPGTNPSEAMEPFTGKTYLTQAAKDLGLVDQIGYLHDATKAAAQSANLSNPRIVQYSIRVSLLSFLNVEDRGVRIDAAALDEITTPRIMMLWKP